MWDCGRTTSGPSVSGAQVWCSVEVAHQVCCLSRFSKSPAARGRHLFAHLCGAARHVEKVSDGLKKELQISQGRSPFYQVYYFAS